MATTEGNDPESSEASTTEEHGSAQGEIDLAALAEKLYELLREEARIERERLGRRWVW